MSSSKVLLGFVAGAAVGALAGILFAPDTGTNTRKKIAHKAGDWTDAAKESFNGLIDGVKKAYSGAQDEAEEFGDKAKGKFNTAKTDVKNALS
jgi:gas vesicle protein